MLNNSSIAFTERCGLFFWLTLKHRIDTYLLLPMAIEAGLIFLQGESFLPVQVKTNALNQQHLYCQVPVVATLCGLFMPVVTVAVVIGVNAPLTPIVYCDTLLSPALVT